MRRAGESIITYEKGHRCPFFPSVDARRKMFTRTVFRTIELPIVPPNAYLM
jgi:hypothetical protein